MLADLFVDLGGAFQEGEVRRNGIVDVIGLLLAGYAKTGGHRLDGGDQDGPQQLLRSFKGLRWVRSVQKTLRQDLRADLQGMTSEPGMAIAGLLDVEVVHKPLVQRGGHVENIREPRKLSLPVIQMCLWRRPSCEQHDQTAHHRADHPQAPKNLHQIDRSEEHPSELQSLMRISYAVFCLKKKITKAHLSY